MNNSKNILVITGSPRRGGNSDTLAEAFIKGATEAGDNVVRFDAGRKKIQGCTACDKCFSKGEACVSGDDFNELSLLAEKADMIVLVTPLYWFSFPAQFKAAIDKFYSFFVAGRKMAIKESMLMVCAETDDAADFGGVVRSYELICNYLKWRDRGMLLVPQVNRKGDIARTDALQKAERMGRGREHLPESKSIWRS